MAICKNKYQRVGDIFNSGGVAGHTCVWTFSNGIASPYSIRNYNSPPMHAFFARGRIHFMGRMAEIL